MIRFIDKTEAALWGKLMTTLMANPQATPAVSARVADRVIRAYRDRWNATEDTPEEEPQMYTIRVPSYFPVKPPGLHPIHPDYPAPAPPSGGGLMGVVGQARRAIQEAAAQLSQKPRLGRHDPTKWYPDHWDPDLTVEVTPEVIEAVQKWAPVPGSGVSCRVEYISKDERSDRKSYYVDYLYLHRPADRAYLSEVPAILFPALDLMEEVLGK